MILIIPRTRLGGNKISASGMGEGETSVSQLSSPLPPDRHCFRADRRSELSRCSPFILHVKTVTPLIWALWKKRELSRRSITERRGKQLKGLRGRGMQVLVGKKKGKPTFFPPTRDQRISRPVGSPFRGGEFVRQVSPGT